VAATKTAKNESLNYGPGFGPLLFNIKNFGVSGGIIATLVNGEPLAPFFSTFLNNASVIDLWGSLIKCTLFGAIIAIVCCYKGMTASGGAEGVGRAVNQAVVIAFIGVFAFNYVFTQTLLATHPELQVVR
jgi:phospholipid/cholesterol/gamma-HCH transport system permease protein